MNSQNINQIETIVKYNIKYIKPHNSLKLYYNQYIFNTRRYRINFENILSLEQFIRIFGCSSKYLQQTYFLWGLECDNLYQLHFEHLYEIYIFSNFDCPRLNEQEQITKNYFEDLFNILDILENHNTLTATKYKEIVFSNIFCVLTLIIQDYLPFNSTISNITYDSFCYSITTNPNRLTTEQINEIIQQQQQQQDEEEEIPFEYIPPTPRPGNFLELQLTIGECPICFDEETSSFLCENKHILACVQCSEKINKCPCCRKQY